MADTPAPNWLDEDSGNIADTSDNNGMVFQSGLGAETPVSTTPTKPEMHVKRPHLARIFLNLVIFLWLVVGLGFYSQNSRTISIFPNNPAHRAATAEQGLLQVKAEIVVQNHVAAVLLLDEIAGMTDELSYASAASESASNSENKRAEFKTQSDDLRTQLSERLRQLHDALSIPASDAENEKADAILSEFIARQDSGAERAEIQDFESAQALLKNDSFKTAILALDAQDWDLAELETLMAQHAEVSRSVQALISQIRGGRHDFKSDWLKTERLVKSVDPLFNTEFSGALSVNKLTLNLQSVVLSGNSNTPDNKNFTLISNLVDTLENSDLFMNVLQRTYSKSSGTESSQGAFSLTMTLETHE